MAAHRPRLGFDRLVRLEWLDATASWTADALPIREIRTRLERLLSGHLAGEGPHSARGKTITVLTHIWCIVPPHVVPLRDDALALLGKLNGRGRLPLHWGMAIATYPFFLDVAGTAGRLIELQGAVTLAQLERRITERWGERTTVTRATQRLVRSLAQWSILYEMPQRGVYTSAPRSKLPSGHSLDAWLIEASMYGNENRARPLHDLVSSPALFPFELSVSSREMARARRLELHRQGLGQDIVVVRR